MDLKPEQIQQMISLLQSMLEVSQSNTSSEDVSHEDDMDKPVHTIKTETHKISSKPRKNNDHNNKFDSMMESRMHKEDTKIDKLLCVHEPTPRLREFTPMRVVCRVCGKQETINPMLLTDTAERYKCNKCARSAG